MQRIRDRIEKALASFGHLVFRNRLKTLFVMLLIIAGLVSQLPKIRIDTSTEGFLHESDPALVDYNAFREQFGRDELVIIAVKPPDVFDRDFLRSSRPFTKSWRRTSRTLTTSRAWSTHGTPGAKETG